MVGSSTPGAGVPKGKGTIVELIDISWKDTSGSSLQHWSYVWCSFSYFSAQYCFPLVKNLWIHIENKRINMYRALENLLLSSLHGNLQDLQDVDSTMWPETGGTLISILGIQYLGKHSCQPTPLKERPSLQHCMSFGLQVWYESNTLTNCGCRGRWHFSKHNPTEKNTIHDLVALHSQNFIVSTSCKCSGMLILLLHIIFNKLQTLFK